MAVVGGDDIVGRIASFLSAGPPGEVLVLATAEHADALRPRLEHLQVHWMDAHATLQAILRDGNVDDRLFDEVVGSAVRQAASRGPVHLFGELVGLLCLEGRHDAALRLEQLWNQLPQTMDAARLCCYPRRVFLSPEDALHFQALKRVHSANAPAGPPAGSWLP